MLLFQNRMKHEKNKQIWMKTNTNLYKKLNLKYQKEDMIYFIF